MKIVMAIIKPFKLDEVRDALTSIGRARSDGDGSQGLWTAEGSHRNLPRRRIRGELPAQAEDRGRRRHGARAARRRSHHQRRETGQIGDGKIFVSPSSAPSAFAPAKPTSTRCDRPHLRKSTSRSLI